MQVGFEAKNLTKTVVYYPWDPKNVLFYSFMTLKTLIMTYNISKFVY